jgi:thiamine pyrophosphokinase
MKLIMVAGGTLNEEWFSRMIPENASGENENYKFMGIDAGAIRLIRMGIKPDYVLGDFDSVSSEETAEILGCGAEKRVLNPIKDETDLEAALRWAVDISPDSIMIFGATGGRMDHTLANLQLLSIPLKANIPAMILDPGNRIRRIRGSVMLRREEQYGKYISLIPVGGEVKGLFLSGFKYSGSEISLPGNSSLGISNELTEDVGEIWFESGELLLIEARD